MPCNRTRIQQPGSDINIPYAVYSPRPNVQPRFSPAPFVSTQIQFPTPTPYILPRPRQSRDTQIQFPTPTPYILPRPKPSDTTKDNPLLISENAPVSECQEPTKPDVKSNGSIADSVSYDFAVDNTESSSQQQPVEESSSNSEQKLPLSRPLYSNNALIGMAIMSSPNRRLGVREVYKAISCIFREKKKRLEKHYTSLLEDRQIVEDDR